MAGHLQARGAIGGGYFCSWGFSWVPWFFMLSGFVLFAAEGRRPQRPGVVAYLSQRCAGIYPLYAASLLLALAMARCYSTIIIIIMLIMIIYVFIISYVLYLLYS